MGVKYLPRVVPLKVHRGVPTVVRIASRKYSLNGIYIGERTCVRDTEWIVGKEYRPRARILKYGKDLKPTKIAFSGHLYILVHEDYINGRKNHVKSN